MLSRAGEMVIDTLELELVTAQQLTKAQSPNMLEEIAQDFKRILQRLDELCDLLDRDFDRHRAELQLAAAGQSLAESHDLARLTWLATIFVPLTYITRLFSMSDDLQKMKGTFKTYFMVAIPVAVVSLMVARGRWGIRKALWYAKAMRWSPRRMWKRRAEFKSGPKVQKTVFRAY